MSRGLRFSLLVAWAVGVAATVLLVLWGVVAGIQYFLDQAQDVSTSNAAVAGNVLAIASINAGRVVDIGVAPGAHVQAGQVLASIEVPAPVRTTTNGTPVLAFLDSRDQQVDVTAPVAGVVSSVAAAAGTSVTQGQTLLKLIDPSQLWVVANVGESDISRVQVGQKAEITLHAQNDRVIPGVVEAIIPETPPPPATAADATAGGPPTFPVQIRADLGAYPQLIGSSADVQIRVQ